MSTPSHLRRAVAVPAAALCLVAAPLLSPGGSAAASPDRGPAAGGTASAPTTTAAARSTRGTTTTTVPRRSTTTTRGGSSTTTTAPGARDRADRQVDVLRSSQAEVRSELDELGRRIRTQSEALLTAHAEADAAAAAAREAQERVAQAQAMAQAAREQVRDYAVEAFIRPPAQDSLAVLAIDQADDAAYAQRVLGIMADQRRDVVDQMVVAQQGAADEQARATAAADAATAREQDARRQLDDLEQLRDQQAKLAAQLDARLDAALSEAAALASIDARAAADLAARETALRSQGPPTPPAATPAATPAARRSTPAPTTTAAPARPAGSTPAPQPTTRPTTTRPPTTSPPSRPTGTVGWTEVTRVGGIWVHTSIASQVRSLLDAATAAGFSLGGGGYRDPQSQITLRQAHCGPTYYDIYQRPASQCTPPTAPPGASMHERGLAIDFMSGGVLITSRADPAFRWLSANASRFGFYNLPSEPWHWSTNGS